MSNSVVRERRAGDPSVAVAIPAYNEAAGIGGFLEEIDQAIGYKAKLRLIVLDDASTDGTREAVEAIAPELTADVEIYTNKKNRGHGPSLMEAYRIALAGDPDYVLQVDGDGQFHGSDLRRVLVLLVDGCRAVGGVRRFRQDPWFRMSMTRLVRAYVKAAFLVRARDANCPLRGYDAVLLRDLLHALPQECLIPNLYLTIVASRRGVPMIEVDVSHRVRRGGQTEGVTWRKAGWSPIPWRLVRFSLLALRESRAFRSQMDAPLPLEEYGPSPLVTR